MIRQTWQEWLPPTVLARFIGAIANHLNWRALLIQCALTLAVPAQAGVVLQDDAGRDVRLAAPAQRIISLSPHITELLFAAGAGERIVGAVEYSDYPEAAKKIPRIGDSQRLDLERIARLKPDLLVAWQHGGERVIDQAKRLGVPVFLSNSKKLANIPATIEAIGKLAGVETSAQRASGAFRTRLNKLAQLHANKPPVRVFFQIWNSPVMTINSEHLISDALRTCGGVNVFAALPLLAPVIDTEAVLAANPDIIIASGDDEKRPSWLDDWNAWPRITAVRNQQITSIPSGMITRHSPRILDGIELLCRQLDTVRAATARNLSVQPLQTGTK